MWNFVPMAAVAFALGLGLRVAIPCATGPWPSVVFAACATVAVLGHRRTALAAAALLVAFLAAGVHRSELAEEAARTAPPLPVGEQEMVVRVGSARPVPDGHLLSVRLLGARSMSAGSRPGRGSSSDTGPWSPDGRAFHLRVDGLAWHPLAGDLLYLRGEVRPPRDALHAYAFDPRAYAASRGISGTIRARSEPALVRSGSGPRTAVDRLRVRIERSLFTRAGERSSGVLVAIVTGSRGHLDPRIRRRFADNGAAHVLAVSGLHLGLLCVGVYRMALAAVRRVPWLVARWSDRALASVLVAPLVVAYVVMTGAPASAVRAGTMALLVLAAPVFGRRADAKVAVAMAALAMLTARPSWIADVGFQLSVTATASLVWMPSSPRAAGDGGRWRRALGAVRRGLGASLRASAVASLATAPVLLWHFGRLPLLSPLTNLVVVPAIAFVALPCALVGGLMDAVGVPGAGAVVLVADGAVRLALGLADGGAPVLEAAVTWGRPRGPSLVACVLVAVVSPWFAVARLRTHALVAAVVAALLLVGRPVSHAGGSLRMHAIPVGQGDATLLVLPDRTRVLIDGGGDPRARQSVGVTAVLPYLHGIGVGRVDVIAASHGDFDHAGGLPDLVRALRPREVWLPPRDDRWVIREMRAAARAVDARVRVITWPLARVNGDTRLVAWSAAAGLSHNDGGIVVRVCQGPVCFLLPGDIEAEREAALLASGAPLGAAVLKVPHHGSTTSSTEPFLDAVLPTIALLHVGEGNRFGFPKQTVVDRYTDRGIVTRRTDRGAVVVSTDGARLWLSR